jgi:hypothetical protein
MEAGIGRIANNPTEPFEAGIGMPGWSRNLVSMSVDRSTTVPSCPSARYPLHPYVAIPNAPLAERCANAGMVPHRFRA